MRITLQGTTCCLLLGLVLSGPVVRAGEGTPKESKSRQPEHVVELYALQYGSSTGNGRFVFADESDEPIKLGWYCWLIRDGEQVILVDCGTVAPRLRRRYGIEQYQDPVRLLARVGVEPASVKVLILSHLHPDHCDGIKLFPEAKVYVQEKEWQAMDSAMRLAPGRAVAGDYLRRHYNYLAGLVKEGRVVLLDGDAEITPAVKVESAPYHTAGTQTVIVTTSQRTFYLVPDNAYVMENVSKVRPIGLSVDRRGNRAYLQKLHDLDPRRFAVIPGHQSSWAGTYPLAADGVYRLDVSYPNPSGSAGRKKQASGEPTNSIK